MQHQELLSQIQNLADGARPRGPFVGAAPEVEKTGENNQVTDMVLKKNTCTTVIIVSPPIMTMSLRTLAC